MFIEYAFHRLVERGKFVTKEMLQFVINIAQIATSSLFPEQCSEKKSGLLQAQAYK